MNARVLTSGEALKNANINRVHGKLAKNFVMLVSLLDSAIAPSDAQLAHSEGLMK